MRVEVIKGIVIVVLFVMTFGLGLLPVKLVRIAQKRSVYRTSRQLRYKRVISLFSCFAAGVFLATCLLDLFPDVREKMGDALDNAQVFTSFPVSEFVMVCGLFLILTVEQIVLFCKEGRQIKQTRLLVKNDVNRVEGDNNSDTLDRFTRSAEFSRHSLETISDRPRSSTYSSASSSQRHSDDTTRPLLGDGHNHGGPFTDEEHPDHSIFRSLMLLIALSLHSVFEGLAVGLQQKVADVLGIFAALALHKCVLSFSLGLSLTQSEMSMGGMIRSLLIFSLASPLGIGIGLGITDLSNSPASHLAEGILQGIACGTFLYVTFFEMLPHEFNTSEDRLFKVLFLLLGYGTVTCILLFNKTEPRPACTSGTIPGSNEGFNLHNMSHSIL